jgi:hypothetical protein
MLNGQPLASQPPGAGRGVVIVMGLFLPGIIKPAWLYWNGGCGPTRSREGCSARSPRDGVRARVDPRAPAARAVGRRTHPGVVVTTTEVVCVSAFSARQRRHLGAGVLVEVAGRLVGQH